MNTRRIITTSLRSILILMFLVGGLGFTMTSGKDTVASEASEPYLVKDINPGNSHSSLIFLTDVKGTLFFSAYDGEELWKSDGTGAGTVMVKDINPGAGDMLDGLTDVNGTLFFSANDGVHDGELWKSDGTPEGTQLVKDINPSGGSDPSYLTDVNGALFFYADDGVHGRELWKSDGTPEGTQLVKDINPGIADSCDQIYEDLCWTELTEMSGMLFFSADDGVHGRALWKSDGTADGTVMVKDIAPNSNFDKVNVLTDVNGTLFFPAGDLVHSVELWKSDGTEAGTLLVKDIYPGGGFGGSSWPRGLTEVNGTLFFKANDGVHDVELWKSDGTPEGTVLVKDIWPGGNSGCCGGMTDVNGTLFFSANDGIHHHYELWKSDGTAEGTVLVKDIWPGGNSSSPSYLTDVNGTLLFSAEDGEHGLELWKSDSTPEGTVMVKDIYPEGDGSSPEELTAVNGTLFFSANDGVHGQELWALNVTDTNEPPTISGTQSGQHINDNAAIDPFTGVTVSDPDDDTLTVIVSLNNANKGDLTNLSGFVEGPSGTYTFVGSPASATTTVRGLTFNPTENRKPPGGTDTTIFTISADDGKADPVTDDTTTVIATSINDPPAWNGTVAGQTVDDNATIDPFTGVTITDPDNNASLTVIVSLDDPDKGTLTNLGGFVEGPDGTYTFIGSPVASTTAIKSLTFAPTGGRVSVGETETTTFTISADDSFATPVTDDTTTVIVSPAGSTKKIYLPLATK